MDTTDENAPDATVKPAAKPTSFNPEDDGFDEKGAKTAGIKKNSVGDYKSNIIDQSGLILIGKKHKDWDKTIKKAKKDGFGVYEVDGRYYVAKSFNKVV